MNAEAVGEECVFHSLSYFVPFLGCYCSTVIRGKIREKNDIEVLQLI